MDPEAVDSVVGACGFAGDLDKDGTLRVMICLPKALELDTYIARDILKGMVMASYTAAVAQWRKAISSLAEFDRKVAADRGRRIEESTA